MRFRRTWLPDMTDDGVVLDYEPAINVFVSHLHGRRVRWKALVDSGSDLSLAPRGLAELLGISWEDGDLEILNGISGRVECQVIGRVHDVKIHLDEIGELVIPICFASGNAPSLIGREVFFDAFRIEFDQPYRTTTFEYLLGDAE